MRGFVRLLRQSSMMLLKDGPDSVRSKLKTQTIQKL